MAFLDELEPYRNKVTVRPEDRYGVLDLRSVLGSPRDDTLIYCCGPAGLIGAVEALCAEWPAGSLHVERFTAPVREETWIADGEFEVECQRSGITVTVPPAVSILDALDDAGVPVVFSCTEGVCGTCETKVVAGAVDHRDSVLTDTERNTGDTMMICVSRAQNGQLVLDI